MHDTKKLDQRALAQKIRWEGGLWSALDYGIKAEDIEDPSLSDLWRRLEDCHKVMAPLLADAMERLDVVT